MVLGEEVDEFLPRTRGWIDAERDRQGVVCGPSRVRGDRSVDTGHITALATVHPAHAGIDRRYWVTLTPLYFCIPASAGIDRTAIPGSLR